MPSSWENYDPGLYLEQPALENWLGHWANGDEGHSPESHVCSIVAAAGVGKTWLMRAVERKWKEGKAASPFAERRLVFWLSVPDMVRMQVNEATLDNDKFVAWLEVQQTQVTDFFKESGKKVDPKKFRKPVAKRTLEYTIEAFAQELCNVAKTDLFPIILVDGYDEIEVALDEMLDDQILEPLSRAECVRIVLGYRAKWGLVNETLKRTKTEINLVTPVIAKEQFERFKSNPTLIVNSSHIMLSDFEGWQNQLHHYKWNHFLINAFLFDLRFTRPPDGKLVAEDLEACAKYLIDRHHGGENMKRPTLPSKSFELLIQVAIRLRDQWSYDDLEDELNVRRTDERIWLLFNYGVLVNIKGSPFCMVVDGLRELLRDLNDFDSGASMGGGGISS